jgi:hypothetical protein
MIEFAFVLLFTAAGTGAALVALRLAGRSVLIRWLALIFCGLALGNLSLYLWRVVAADLQGAAQAAGIAGSLALLVWGYRRSLRALRRRADRSGR